MTYKRTWASSCACPEHQKLGPPPWYPYRSQEEADKASSKFVASLVAKFKEKEKNMVRGKFVLNSITNHSWSPTAQTFNFGAVYDNTTEENKRFAKYTPSGTLSMTVDNPPAQEFFELGKSYYLDFSKAE
jgi:hypothetical protein